jgi:hypothetical protein
MKSSISGFRSTASNLSESVQQHFSMHALAALVGVLSVLALAQPSEARIVYTPANVQIFPNKRYKLALKNDGVTDFTISTVDKIMFGCPGGGVGETSASGNGVEVSPESSDFALPLNKRNQIGPGQSFYGGRKGMVAFMDYGKHCMYERAIGPWRDLSNRYLGLMFQINGKTYYGWAQVNVGVDTAALRGYAYETIPGKSIKAGQKKETAGESVEEKFGATAFLTNPIPESPQPASLGMLALGAQGMPLWRRKESEGAASENN